MSYEDKIAAEVRAFARLNLEGLRAEWRRRYGPPPKLRSPDLLARLLAWRVQSEALGGLGAETKRKLRRAAGAKPPRAKLQPGLKIAREWKGERIEVEVVEEGFRFRGETHASLSKIARVVTGVRWNGPRFFGLQQEEAR